MVIFIANTIFIKKAVPFPVWKWKDSAVVISSIIMGGFISLLVFYADIEHWSRMKALLFSGSAVIAGAFTYFILLIITRGIDRTEIASMPLLNKWKSKGTN